MQLKVTKHLKLMFTFIDRCTHRSTSLALTFDPLQESPLHRSQNKKSAFLNSVGFLPSILTPGISFSVSTTGLEIVSASGGAMLKLLSILTRLVFMFSYRGFPNPSANMNSVHWTKFEKIF